MGIPIIQSLVRRPSALLAVAAMVQRQPAVGGGRCLGYCTQVANNKKAEVDLTFTLEGLDGCQLESVLPLVYQHLDLVGLRQTMSKHLTSTLPPKTRFNIHFKGVTAFQGFEVSETENLLPSSQQYMETARLHLDKAGCQDLKK